MHSTPRKKPGHKLSALISIALLSLAAGNTVVLKPSEYTSASILEFMKVVEQAGFHQRTMQRHLRDQVGERLGSGVQVRQRAAIIGNRPV